MRRMTLEEQEHLISSIAHALQSAGFVEMDSICYGGNVEVHAKDRWYLSNLIEAIPKDIVDAYNASLRRAKADRLRAKADATERGEQEQHKQ